MNSLAIFASGSGSNAEQIIRYFKDSDRVRVALVLSNNPEAYVLKRAAGLAIPNVCFTRAELYHPTSVLDLLEEYQIDFIVLAGFLWMVPENILDRYPGSIINIHPALLPKYGGKGMYGMRVHEAVIAAGERESGITIHHVNECYDKGDIIFQAKCSVLPGDTPESLAGKVHALEHEWYPKIIEKTILFEGFCD